MYLNRHTRHIISLIFAALLALILVLLSAPAGANTGNNQGPSAKTESKCFFAGCYDARHYYTQEEEIRLDPNKMMHHNPTAAGLYRDAQQGCFTQHCFNRVKVEQK